MGTILLGVIASKGERKEYSPSSSSKVFGARTWEDEGEREMLEVPTGKSRLEADSFPYRLGVTPWPEASLEFEVFCWKRESLSSLQRRADHSLLLPLPGLTLPSPVTGQRFLSSIPPFLMKSLCPSLLLVLHSSTTPAPGHFRQQCTKYRILQFQ